MKEYMGVFETPKDQPLLTATQAKDRFDNPNNVLTVNTIDDMIKYFGLPPLYPQIKFLDYEPMPAVWVKRVKSRKPSKPRPLRKLFLETVTDCKHDYYPNYTADPGRCSCNQAVEYHCRKCKVYVTECDCGELAGIDGWSCKRRDRFEHKRNLRR